MPATAQAPEVTMDPTQAYELLWNNVQRPAFLAKLARDYSIEPENAEEERQLFEIAGRLRNLQEASQVKTAGQRNQFLTNALNRLDGVVEKTAAANHDQRIEKIAAEYAKNPAYRQAVISYQNSVASEIVAQRGSEAGSGHVTTEGN